MPSANMSYPAPPPYSWHTVNSSQTVNSIPTQVRGGVLSKHPPLGLCANNTVVIQAIWVRKTKFNFSHSIEYGVMLN